MNNTSPTQLNKFNFYINTDKSSFIADNRLLSDEYNGIEKLLNLDSKNYVFNIGDKPVVILEPYFNDDGEFYCFPLKDNLQHEDETQQDLLKVMYDKWLLEKPKVISISATKWNINDPTLNVTTLIEYNTKNIQLAIGFSPQYSVYPNTYALPEEELPEWVQEWVSDDALKIDFLAALGVHTEISNLVKLRIYLENKNEPIFSNLGAISDYPRLLSNTLNWLYEAGIKFRESDEAALGIIRRIYDLVATESNLSWLTIEQLNDKLITGKIRLFSSQGYLYLKSITSAAQDIIDIQLDKKLIVEAKTKIRLEFEQIAPFSVYFVEDGKDWLIYQYES